MSRTHGSLPTEASNYVGLLTLLLAGGWIVVAWRRRRSLSPRARVATAGLSAVVVVSLLLALPSPIGLLGHLWTWTPARLLYEVLPAFRVPSRWVALLMTALVPLAALGLEAGRRALARPPARRGSAAVPAARSSPVRSPSRSWSCSSGRSAGSRARTPCRSSTPRSAGPAGILAEYPLRRSHVGGVLAAEINRPLLNGALDGTFAATVTRTLIDPDARGTPERLALLGDHRRPHETRCARRSRRQAARRPRRELGGRLRTDATLRRRLLAVARHRVARAGPRSSRERSASRTCKRNGSVGHTFGGPTGLARARLSPDQVVRVELRGDRGRRSPTLAHPRRIDAVRSRSRGRGASPCSSTFPRAVRTSSCACRAPGTTRSSSCRRLGRSAPPGSRSSRPFPSRRIPASDRDARGDTRTPVCAGIVPR